MTPRRALWGLIVVSGLARLVWAASLGPGNDEAYHYLFTVHPDWSYFDHPPMLALVERLGIALAGGAVSVFSLRLGFVLLFGGSTWLMARLTSRFYGDRAGLLAAFALNVTAYYTAAAGAFALPDGPLLFFWLLTLDRLAEAVVAPESTGNRAWAAVGLAWGGALLSKYHAVFLPAGALLYLAVEPSARRWLRRPGPYLAVGVGLLVFAPVIGWNAAHGWASFAFQGGRAIGSARFRPETLLAAMFLPGLYLLPWIWVRLVTLLFGRARRFFDPETPAADRFLLCQSVIPLGTFLAVACTRPVLPHWTLVGFLPLFPMAGRAWARDLAADPVAVRQRLAVYAVLPVLVAAMAVFEARTGYFQKGRPGAWDWSARRRTRRRTWSAGTPSRANSDAGACSTGPTRFCSRQAGIRAASLPLPSEGRGPRSSATTPGTPAASPSGASPASGSAATASSSRSARSRPTLNASAAGSPGSSRWAPSRSTARALRCVRSGSTDA